MQSQMMQESTQSTAAHTLNSGVEIVKMKQLNQQLAQEKT
jgi:hypothetical protein